MRTITIPELRATRLRYKTIRDTAGILRNLGYMSMAAQLLEDAAHMATVHCWIDCPCLCCGRVFPEAAIVGDPRCYEPGTTICDSCSHEVMEGAGSDGEPY